MARNGPVTRGAVTRAAAHATGAFQAGGVRRLRSVHSLRILLLTLLFSLVVVLPQAMGVYPLPYHVGQTSNRDIFSRVRFAWQDPGEEERRLKALEDGFARIYREEEEWVREILDPVVQLLQKAVEADAPDALLAWAKERDLRLGPKQAAVLHRAVRESGIRFGLQYTVLSPLQRIFMDWLSARGILSNERYQIERNREIQVIGPYGGSRTIEVDPARRDSPLPLSEVRAVLADRLRRQMELTNVEFRSVLLDLLMGRMRPSLRYDEALSEQTLAARKDRALSRTRVVEKDSLLVARDQTITPKILQQLRAEDRAYRRTMRHGTWLLRLAGKVVLVFLIALAFIASLPLAPQTRKHSSLAGIALATLLTVAAAYGALLLGANETLVPIGFLAGTVALGTGVVPATLAVVASALLLLVLFEGQPAVVLGLLAGGWLYARLAPRRRDRLGLVLSALGCGVVTLVILLAWSLSLGEVPGFGAEQALAGEASWTLLGMRAGGVLGGWLFAGVAVLLALPLVERFSGRTSNVRLRDLQNLEHPVLRRLLVEAPGTYHHSVIVGRLAEAAADAIGANGLLAKVASYFHDIGKLLKPGYFSENESTFSRHDVLSPSMSALIIIAHVKDGAEMGQELRLPREILDVIEQHHGTSLVRFFYHRAQKEAAARGAKTPETAYRYPGPLPQSREAGLVMLADAVEAASRSLAAPTEPQIRKLVHNVATEKLLDGQLDESGLTLTQIRRAESVFVRILTSLYHVRVAYPEGNAREGGPRRDRIRSASAS